MGNSEVGHMNIGAGRIVYQDLTRIDAAIEDGSFFSNPQLRGACDDVHASGGTLHVFGLLSPGGGAVPADAGAVDADETGQENQREYDRSEEHTSELQSLMRISYAAFRLKKKKN